MSWKYYILILLLTNPEDITSLSLHGVIRLFLFEHEQKCDKVGMLLYKEPWFLDNILLYNVLNWLIRLIYNLLYFISDILDGDIKSILDVLWLIILNYAVHSIGKFTMISNIASLAVHVFTYLCYNELLLILWTYLFWEPNISQLVSMIIVY